MARPKRTKEARLDDMVKMTSMLRRGVPRYAIAQQLGVSAQQISYDWKVVVRQYHKDMNADIEELIGEKLLQYAEIKKEAWEAWEKSKLDAEEETTEEFTSAKYSNTKTISKKSGRCGDPNFLKIICQCMKEECELQCLYPAKEIKGTVTSNVINWDALVANIPDEGEIPDRIEQVIREAMEPQKLEPLGEPEEPDGGYEDVLGTNNATEGV
jgi:hypothetical protein